MLRPRHEGFISYCSNHQQTLTYLQLNIHNNQRLVSVLIHLKYEKPGGHWIIRDPMGLDLVGLASL